jgi:hypothetical protein
MPKKTEKRGGKNLIRQKKLASNLSANIRSRKQAMIKSGYSKSYAASAHIKNTKSWQELMNKYLPDDEVLAEHRAGLHATKPIGALVLIKKDGEKETVYKDNEGMIEVDDTTTRLKAVEMAYKLKGKYVEKHEIEGRIETVEIIRYGKHSHK